LSCFSINRCRHGVFASYFGDEPPPCKAQKQCDVCKNPGSVKKSIEEFYKHIYKCTNLMLTEDESAMYGGGRKSQKRY
jgi:hypothetical protein